jgi:four helix bundle protein
MAITSYRDLDVYRRSMQALVAVHKLVLKFPEYERYALADQMRRASKSIPTNIAEGYGRRKSAKEFKHFLGIALGSANEMIVHLEITQALEYAKPEICNSLIEDYTVICKMLYRLIESWRTIPTSKSSIRKSASDLRLAKRTSDL